MSFPGRTPGAALWFLLPVGIPLAAVFIGALQPAPEVWPHLVEHVLGRVAANTLWLVLGVGVFAGAIGAALGGLVALTDFPGRRVFEWALLLPLAIPGYVLAFVFIGLFDFSGPLQQGLREAGMATGWLPDIRGRGGVILVLVLALYPYVYLLARGAFRSQGARAMEAAQSLGHSRGRAFVHAALPLARPWIAGGIGLVVMETLADFGTVAAFNYDTFTTAIYKTWFSLFSFEGALQLSSLLAVLVLVVLLIEQELRRRRRFIASGNPAPAPRVRLAGGQAVAAFTACAAVLLVAFVIPVIQLLAWSIEVFAAEFSSRYLAYLGRTLLLAGVAAGMTIMTAILFGYVLRGAGGFRTRLIARVATLGYALPGPVLAVGFFAAVAALGDAAAAAWESVGGEAGAFHVQGTLLVLFAAYLARFFAVGFAPVENAFGRIRPQFDDAARNLGATRTRVLREVHAPLLGAGVWAGATLVFVDVLKEMPITLMLRPFGWETLAVRVFELTSEGEYARAALPSIVILLAGLLPVLILFRRSDHAAGN